MGFGYYVYPWTLHDPIAEVSAMRDAGLSHVTIAASYHAGKFIQPRDPKARVYFPEDGAAYFWPSQDYGRLRPKVAEVTRAHDVLEDVSEAQVLPVRAWTVLCHNSRLGFANPDLTTQNVYGDCYPYSLCPSQSEVRDYAVRLCADLASGYDLQSLLLETPGWMTYAHGYHHEFAQVAPNDWFEGMMGLCFCPSCCMGAKAAGIDADGLARRIRLRVDAFLNGAPAVDIAYDRANDPELEAFLNWRCEVVASLCSDIRAEVRPEVQVRVISTCQRGHDSLFWEGGDLNALDAATDGLELPIYQPSVADAHADLDVVMRQIAPHRSSVILRPGHPDMRDEAQLRDTLSVVQSAGITDISFYNYGLLPARNLEWVARAIADTTITTG